MPGWKSRRSRRAAKTNSDDGSSGDDSDLPVETLDNNIYFYGEVNPQSLRKFTKALHSVTRRFKTLVPDSDPADFSINVFIHSLGGDVYCGLALYDAVRSSEIPVTGIVQGAAASAATLLLMGCTRRLMYPSSYLLIHQISSSFWGTHKEWQDEHLNLGALMKKLKRIYCSLSSIPSAKIDGLLEHDRWFSAKKCRRYGLVDGKYPG